MTKHLAGKLLIIFLISRMALVLLLFIFPDAGVIIDSHVYLDLASNLESTGVYFGVAGEDLIRPAGYPIFILLVSGLQSPNPILIAFIQLAITGLVSIILYQIGAVAGTETGGLAAGWLNALSPHLALWSLTVMTETVFAFLLVLGVYFWYISMSKSRVSWAFFAGCSVGLATLFRPIGLYIVIIWFVLSMIYLWRNGEIRSGISSALLILVGAALFILPWMLRNQIVHDRFTLSIVSTKTLYGFNLAYVLASAEGIDREEAVDLVVDTGNPLSDTLLVLRQYPRTFFQEQLGGVLRTAFGVETGVWARLFGYGIERQGGFGLVTLIRQGRLNEAISQFWSLATNPTTAFHFLLGAFGMLFTIAVYLLSVLSILWASREKGLAPWLIGLLIITSLYLLVSPGAAGQARFRVPVEPLLISLAGFGWALILSWSRSWREWNVIPTSG